MRTTTTQFSVLLCLLLLLSATVGCGGDGPELAPVCGSITFNDQPVAGLEVTFQPKTKGGSSSMGVTDETGEYELMYTYNKEGALIGTHDVLIDYGELTPQKMRVIPAASRRGLTAEVTDGANVCDFELKP